MSLTEQGLLVEVSSQLYQLENRLNVERGQQRNRRVPCGGVRRVRVPHSTTVPRDEGIRKSETCRPPHFDEVVVVNLNFIIFGRNATSLRPSLSGSRTTGGGETMETE